MESKQEFNFKLGDPVLYRFPSTTWRVALWGDDNTYGYDGNIRDNLEVVPIEGNEHLHGTYDKVKPTPWRADFHKKYFFIDNLSEVKSSIEDYTQIDNARYGIGNYFETEYDARLAVQKIINTLKR